MTQPPQQQQPPGVTEQMQPKPDHGEETYRGSGRLTDKATIITGGDSGIGKAVAIAFAREGADVLISYLPEEEEDAQDTKRWVEEADRKAVLGRATSPTRYTAGQSSTRRWKSSGGWTCWSTTRHSR